MLSVLITIKQNHKGHKKILIGVAYGFYLDHSDNISGACICPNLSIVHIKYALFLYINYTSTKLIRKTKAILDFLVLAAQSMQYIYF